MSHDDEDRAAVDAIQAKLARGEEEFVPAAVVDRLLAGENPLRVWREHRCLTIATLAELSGVDPGALSTIESGHSEGAVEPLASLATALNVEPRDLTNTPPEV